MAKAIEMYIEAVTEIPGRPELTQPVEQDMAGIADLSRFQLPGMVFPTFDAAHNAPKNVLAEGIPTRMFKVTVEYIETASGQNVQ